MLYVEIAWQLASPAADDHNVHAQIAWPLLSFATAAAYHQFNVHVETFLRVISWLQVTSMLSHARARLDPDSTAFPDSGDLLPSALSMAKMRIEVALL